MPRPKRRQKHAGQPSRHGQRHTGGGGGQRSRQHQGGQRSRQHQGGQRSRQHQGGNRISYAPYNFVPLPDKVIRVDSDPRFKIEDTPLWVTHDRYVDGLYSGWIDITITNETPLFIRCGPPRKHSFPEDPKDNEHRQDFFHHGDRDVPVIPGSSIRGMVRSLVEIVSYSKFLPDQHFTDKRLIYRMVGGSSSAAVMYRSILCDILDPTQGAKYHLRYPSKNMHGGFLEKQGARWYIKPSKVIEGTSIIHIPCNIVERYDRPSRGWGHNPEQPYTQHDILKVFVKPPELTIVNSSRGGYLQYTMAVVDKKDYSQFTQDGYEEAWVIKGGRMHNRKYYAAIYGSDDNKELIPIPQDMWRLYVEDARMNRGLYTRNLEEAYYQAGNTPVPLFYICDDNLKTDENPYGLMFFGSTMMFRIPYKKTIGEHVPAELKSTAGVDLVEGLFGTVYHDSDRPSIKSRVQFEDATMDRSEDNRFPFLNTDRASSRRVPLILSGPKPTSFQHYLRQPAKAFENQSELKCWSGDKEDTNTLAPIRGFKQYWHKKNLRDEDIFELTESGNSFLKSVPSEDKQHTVIRPVRPHVQFKGRIRFQNLNEIELGALLTVLDLPDSKRHKLGMGRPLGMGTVKIDPTVYVIDHKQRYSALFGSNNVLDDFTTTLDDSFISKLKEAFAKFILSNLGHDGSDLWNVPRLADLWRMLEWEQPPSKHITKYAPLENIHLWRQRFVLPEPKDVR